MNKEDYVLSIVGFVLFFLFSAVISVVLAKKEIIDFLVSLSIFIGIGFSILFYFLFWFFMVEEEKMKDTWQFKFLTFGQAGGTKRINACEISGMIFVVFVHMVISVYAFFFARKVDDSGELPLQLTSPYEKWPTFFGHRIWPISIIALFFVGWGFWELALRYQGFDYFFDFALWWRYLFASVSFLCLLYLLNKFRKSEKWQKTKQATKDSFAVFFGKICISKEVKDEKN